VVEVARKKKREGGPVRFFKEPVEGRKGCLLARSGFLGKKRDEACFTRLGWGRVPCSGRSRLVFFVGLRASGGGIGPVDEEGKGKGKSKDFGGKEHDVGLEPGRR